MKSVFVLLVSCICMTLGQTCERLCGENSGSCSCHSTCTSLKTCCTDYKEYCVEIFPYSGVILGGTDFIVPDVSFSNSSEIVCRFKDNIDTVGYVDENSRGHCISPLLYETGWVPLRISSDNGTTFNRDATWLSVHTGKLDAHFKATLVNSTKWQYYGTPGVGGTLEMTWNTSLVRAERVNIELWGYKETGKPYTSDWKGEWEYLYSLAKDQLNNGSFSFLPKPAENGFASWELGSLRISLSTNPDGMWNVQAVWTEDHALAWHLEEKFRWNSTAWALEKCVAWDQLENQLPNFLSEIIDCPCTLAQARADTGRFHTDYGCDIEKGSVCTYHPGSVHCVRAIQARFHLNFRTFNAVYLSFCLTGAVNNESALFTYDSEYLLDAYNYAPRHDVSFIPVFSVPENPDDPLANQASELCSGEGAQFCRYDILVGRSPRMGNASKESFQSHVSLVEDLKRVISCGWLSPPANGEKNGTTYLQGAKVQLSCDDGYTLKGSAERVCQENGLWSGEDTSCVVPSMNK
ncbi:sushi domain-containing protein 2-like [Sebastes umbrosus]|uniref:sushi domain-containing protein 2-like n=1 Tax=Sebastes umbrosus TaxID=72105 RepID=UPI00189FDFB5|nr:sushi domain-containing protein 2-like [Sebastes umbrosus]